MSKIEKLEEKLDKLIETLSENEDDIQVLIDWRRIISNYELSEEFLKKHYNHICWFHRYICRYQKLSEDFLDLYGIFITWPSLSRNQYLTENMMKKYCDKLDWIEILTFQKLSEEFLTDFVIPNHYDVDWTLICNHQNLSEEFIRQHIDLIDWYEISVSQTLSKDFMIEFANKLDFSNIIMYQQNIDEDLIRAYSHQINSDNIYAIAHLIDNYHVIPNLPIILTDIIKK